MIYLDAGATVNPYPEVISIITDVLTNNWGNASSAYEFGHQSKEIVESVRDQIAADINCKPEEIIFTSGGCEANSLAISGISRDEYDFFTTRLEHASILEAAPYVGKFHFVKNDKFGNIQSSTLNRHLKWHSVCSPKKPFVSIGAANSEIGTLQDIKALAKIVHSFDGIFHCDATALYPHKKIDVQELGIDMMTVSAQKFHATEGIGFLYVREGIRIKPIIYGVQERGLRGGSYNTALIAGMGKALEITRAKNNNEYCKYLRDMMLNSLLEIPGVRLNGPSIGSNRLENNINITIDRVDAETLLSLCDMYGVCISKGSACHSYVRTSSATLKAINLTDKQAAQTIRITLDMFNTYEEIEKASKILKFLINDIRNPLDK